MSHPTFRAGHPSTQPCQGIAMSIHVRRVLLTTGAAFIALSCSDQIAIAQEAGNAPTVLPEVRVTAPTPIVRRAPAPARPSTAAPAAPAAPAEPQPGTLPVVTDQFATVTVVPNEEIRRNGGTTLGDLLFSKPGITGSSFAPGASSRPIIRGLDVNRVGIVENGIGGGAAS